MSKFNVGDKVNWTRTRLSWQNAELVEYVKGGEFDGDCRVNCDLMGIGIIPEEELELVPSLSPIRTVTRREIVPGVYGRLHVSHDPEPNGRNLRIALADIEGKFEACGHYWNKEELSEVIHTLTQIREALEDE